MDFEKDSLFKFIKDYATMIVKEGDIDLLLTKCRDLVGRRKLMDFDGHSGIHLSESSQCRSQTRTDRKSYKTDIEDVATTGGISYGSDCFIVQLDDLMSIFQKLFTGGSQAKAKSFTDKQISSQFFFQVMDKTAHCRLRDIQTTRSATDVEFFRCCNEISDMPEFHELPAITLSGQYTFINHFLESYCILFSFDRYAYLLYKSRKLIKKNQCLTCD
ncbi:MAG: hypothetical protein A4E66_02516 [Syntrophus sp. PtaB.Bin001]|nr:MAG: hypothetical protein A4E66_02516 [Syntrophus sp. PtaB.Bin001]